MMHLTTRTARMVLNVFSLCIGRKLFGMDIVLHFKIFSNLKTLFQKIQWIDSAKILVTRILSKANQPMFFPMAASHIIDNIGGTPSSWITMSFIIPLLSGIMSFLTPLPSSNMSLLTL